MESSYGQPQFFLEILFVRRSGFLGTMGVIGYSIEFDDRPAAEIYFAQSFEDGGDVHESMSELDPAIGMLEIFTFRKAFDIFDMQKEQAIAERLDGFHGVAPALEIVRDIQFQLDVPRIRQTHDLIEFFGAFTKRTHMIVISERNSEVGGALAKLGESFGQLFEVHRGRRTALGAIVENLEIESACVAQEFGMRRMLGNALFRGRGIAEQISAGKRHELQLVLAKQIAHRGGASKLRDAVGSQLNAAKTNRSNVVDGLAIVAAPGDRRITEMDFGRRRRDRR